MVNEGAWGHFIELMRKSRLTCFDGCRLRAAGWNMVGNGAPLQNLAVPVGRRAVMLFYALYAGFGYGCPQAGAAGAIPAPPRVAAMNQSRHSAAAGEKIIITGVRLTKGNAVDCPQVRTDDGRIVGVSYLPPAIAIGDRVEVTGFMAVTTKCRGRVLVAEEVRQPEN